MKITSATGFASIVFAVAMSAGWIEAPPATAQDATSAPVLIPLYQPPSLAIRSMDSDNADAVPASGISGQVSANQINSVDGSQITGVVSRAASADTASTAQSLDPNAKLNLPVCNGDQVITNNPVDGTHCVQVATGATGFANKAFLNTNGQSWTVPDGVFTMRLTGAAGATLQARPAYQQTGQTFTGMSTASCPVYSPGLGMGPPSGYYGVWSDGYWSIACPNGYSWNNNAVGCCSGLWDNGGTASKANYTPTYGCVANNTNSAGSSGNKVVSVTPGQTISVAISSQTVAVAGGPAQCPWSDTVYSVVTSSPDDAIHSDQSSGEQPGEASVSSVGILEW